MKKIVLAACLVVSSLAFAGEKESKETAPSLSGLGTSGMGTRGTSTATPVVRKAKKTVVKTAPSAETTAPAPTSADSSAK